MKVRDFFERFDMSFDVYNKIEMDVESNGNVQRFEIIDEDEAFSYASAWWGNLEIVCFSFDANGVLYIVAKEKN